MSCIRYLTSLSWVLMDRLHGVQSHFQQSKSIHWHNHKSILPHQLNLIQTETSQPPQNQPAHTVLPTLAEQPPPPPSNVKMKVACPTQTAPPPPTVFPLENVSSPVSLPPNPKKK